MSHTSPSSRIFAITLILFALAAIAVSFNWGSRFGFSSSAAPESTTNDENGTVTIATPTPTPLFVSTSLPNLVALPGATIGVPIIVDDTTGRGIISYDLQVTFDPAVLSPSSPPYDSSFTLSSGMQFTTNTNNAGHLILGAFVPGAFPPLEGSERLLFLTFTVVGIPGQQTALTFENYTDPGNVFHSGFMFNEGIPSVLTTNGSLTIVADLTPTPTSTGTASPTNTATNTPTPSISGKVRYGNSIGPPSLRNVSGVTVSGAGSLPVSALTNANGDYLLSGFGSGSYDIIPSRAAGTSNFITSFDAARIAQKVASIGIPFNAVQTLVADVSGGNGITSFDAGLVAKFVAASPPFGLTGSWQFSPSTVTHSMIQGNITDNFFAYLFGEVSGNWMNTGSRESKGPENGIRVSLTEVQSFGEKEIAIPVSVEGVADKDIISYQFDLRYDASVIHPLANAVDVAGTVSRGLAVVTNAIEPGLLRVVVYGPLPIDKDGVLLNLRFTSVGSAGSVSSLSFEKIMFNEGESRVNVTAGQVELF